MISFGISVKFPKGIYGKIFLRKFLKKRLINITDIEFGADIISSAHTDIIKLWISNDGVDDFEFQIGQFLAEMICLTNKQFDYILENDIYRNLEKITGFGSTNSSDARFYITTKYSE